MHKNFHFFKIVVFCICTLYNSFSFGADGRPLLEEDGRPSHAARFMMPPGSYTPPQWGPDTSIQMERHTYSHVTHVGGNVHAADGGQVLLNPQITQILEHSPNRFVYSQMIACPPADLTGAFEAADGNYRATPQARSVHMGTFKAIADAGHPLAKERYADLLFENLTVERRDMRSARRFDAALNATGHGELFLGQNSYRYKKEHSKRAALFKNVLNSYNDCLQYYKPSSAYLYQLKAKVDRTNQAIENEERQVGYWKTRICRVIALGTTVIVGGGIALGLHFAGVY